MHRRKILIAMLKDDTTLTMVLYGLPSNDLFNHCTPIKAIKTQWIRRECEDFNEEKGQQKNRSQEGRKWRWDFIRRPTRKPRYFSNSIGHHAKQYRSYKCTIYTYSWALEYEACCSKIEYGKKTFVTIRGMAGIRTFTTLVQLEFFRVFGMLAGWSSQRIAMHMTWYFCDVSNSGQIKILTLGDHVMCGHVVMMFLKMDTF